MNLKKIYLVGILLMCVSLVVLSKMSGSIADIDGKYDGFSSGFNYNSKMRSNTVVAARSGKTEFDIDDVTLDFYFGWHKYPPYSKEEALSIEVLVVAFYFCKPEEFLYYINADDYRNIENNYFAAELSMEEFIDDEFSVVISKSSGKTLNNSKNLTVPKELFDRSSSSFYFCVRYIQYSNESNTYLASEGDVLVISYEYVNDNTIRLHKNR